MATIKIKWRVSNLDNVLQSFNVCKVYRATAKDGTYSEITGPGTRVALQAGVTEYTYDDLNGDPSYWYKVSYFHVTTLVESAQSAPIQGLGGGNYLTIQDARDRGFTETLYSDADVLDAILDAESLIEHTTGRWFYPRYLTIRVDGTGSHVLPLIDPVIQVDEVKMLGYEVDFGSVTGAVSLDSMKVSNRHLTQGLREPDDREAPSLIFDVFDEAGPHNVPLYYYRWDEGEQNVQIKGWFGFTELSAGETPGETSVGSQVPLSKGSTPRLIKKAALLLLPRFLASPADPDAWADATKGWAVEKIKVRDQEIVYNKQAFQQGNLSGDAEVDRILSMFTRGFDAYSV